MGRQNLKFALLMIFENIEVYALFGRTKWTQNLRQEDQNRFQGPGRSVSQISQGDPATEKSKNPIIKLKLPKHIFPNRRFLLQRLRELLVPSFRSRQPAGSSPQVGLERKYSTLSTNTKTEKEKMFPCKQKNKTNKKNYLISSQI